MTSFKPRDYRAADPNMTDREYWADLRTRLAAMGTPLPQGTMVEIDRLLRLLEELRL